MTADFKLTHYLAFQAPQAAKGKISMSETGIWLGFVFILVAANIAAWWRFGRGSIRRAFGTFAVVTAIGLGFAYLPFAWTHKSYFVPTNAMAPTIRGRHFLGVCPHCGGQTVVSLFENSSDGSSKPGETGMCTSCLQVHPAQEIGPDQHAGDRIFVRRMRQPRRWDIVTFRPWPDAKAIYAMRLIGMPGESIEVKDGGVWIDGARLVPPPEIATVRWFLPEEYSMTQEFAGPGNPTQLKDDEYFFLGDNSPNSSDSRFFGPVPAEDVGGVVTAIYWPPSRAQSLPTH